jgi:hypothetical protein
VTGPTHLDDDDDDLRPPAVEARSVLMSDRSIAVRLCPLRLCDWHSDDVRTMPDGGDTSVREHLIAEHAEQLRAFRVLAGALPEEPAP